MSKNLVRMVKPRPWNVMPAAAAKNVVFKYDNEFFRWARYMSWHYGWDGREYGLLFHDQAFLPAPEVTEAIRRLNLKEPWLYDERKMRLLRATHVRMNNMRLPRNEWTQWDQESFYLKPYFDEIEAEKESRGKETGSGLLPGFMMRIKREESH